MSFDRSAISSGREAEGVDAPSRPDQHAAYDPLHPSATLLIKLGSALVHAEEMSAEGAHELDLAAFYALAADPEVVEWREAMDKLALLPVKR